MKGLRIRFSKKSDGGLYPYNEVTREDVDMDTLRDTVSCIQYDSGASRTYEIGVEGNIINEFNGRLIPIFTKNGFVKDGDIGTPVSMNVLAPMESFNFMYAGINSGDWLVAGNSIYRVKRGSASGDSVVIDGLSLDKPLLRDFEVPASMFDRSRVYEPRYEVPKEIGSYTDRNGFEWVNTGKDFHLKDMSNELSVGWGGSKFPEFFAPFTKMEK